MCLIKMDSVCADKSVGKKWRREAFEHGPGNLPATHRGLIVLKFLHNLLFHFNSVTFSELNAVSSSSLCKTLACKNAFTSPKDTVGHTHTITVVY